VSTPVQAPAGQQPADSAGRRAIWLAIAALAMTFMLPLAGLVMGVFALMAGIRALPQLKNAGKPPGIAVGGIAVSSIALTLSALATAMQLYLMDEYSAYQNCMKGAGTVSSQGECFTQFRDAAQKKLPPDVLELLGAVQP
jgi:ABC-type Fe3+ transport system permease subunit